jgi:hypothetical protein
MASTSTDVLALEQPRRSAWIASPGFDLAFFSLSPLVGLAVILLSLNLSYGTAIMVAASFLLGMPHYVASFTFYLADDSRAHYLSRPIAFVAVPLLIVAAVFALRVEGWATPVILVMFVWNVYHVSMQSSGILGLYRRLNGGADNERRLAKISLLCVASAMTLWQPGTFPPLHTLLESLWSGSYWLLWLGFTVAGTASTALLVMKMLRRPGRIGGSESAFLASSLLLFHPYLWVEDGNLATLGMLCGHFLQYLAIVWLVHHRKHSGATSGSAMQRALRAVSRNSTRVVCWIVATAAGVYALSRLLGSSDLPVASVIFLNSLALVHFYLDGRIWAFSEPFVRSSIGTYLTRGPARG